MTSTNPANGAINVPVNTNIAITFSVAMNKTATEGAISANPSITGTFSWDGASKVVTWTPGANLQSNTKYWVNISTVAKSQAGINLPSLYTFSFTTIGGTPTPPTITNTNPANSATNVPVTTTIAITFSKAMNKSATEPAITVSPTVTWTPAWTSGDTVVTFTPSANLQAGTMYTITISTAAKSADGANLASQYVFSFTTASGPVLPTVTGTNPTNNSNNMPVNTQIIIAFSLAMDKTVTQGAISSSPAITGTFAWDGTSKTVTWTPGANLQASTKHTVTISVAAKSQAGVNMKNPYIFSFTTGTGTGPTPPTVMGTSPTNGAPNVSLSTNIEITFSEVMDKTPTEGAISSSPSISGTFSWDGTTKIVTWNPGTDLQSSTSYAITVSAAAKSQAGANMQSAFSFSFTTKGTGTPPTVVSTNPTDKQKDVDKGTKVTIIFSEAMSKTATAGSVSISPGTITDRSWSNDSVLVLTVSLDSGTTYNVTVGVGAKDLAGNSMLSGYIFSFTTEIKTCCGPNNNIIFGMDVTTFSLLMVIIIVIVVIAIIAALVMMRKKKAQPPVSPPMPNYSFYGQQPPVQDQYYQQPGQQQPPPPGY